MSQGTPVVHLAQAVDQLSAWLPARSWYQMLIQAPMSAIREVNMGESIRHPGSQRQCILAGCRSMRQIQRVALVVIDGWIPVNRAEGGSDQSRQRIHVLDGKDESTESRSQRRQELRELMGAEFLPTKRWMNDDRTGAKRPGKDAGPHNPFDVAGSPGDRMRQKTRRMNNRYRQRKAGAEIDEKAWISGVETASHDELNSIVAELACDFECIGHVRRKDRGRREEEGRIELRGDGRRGGSGQTHALAEYNRELLSRRAAASEGRSRSPRRRETVSSSFGTRAVPASIPKIT